ncbi:hypothetical protein VAE122_2930017 [Vibrio aestuarianus]|uniref:Uncharacterized protein n=1 Tax=Vibrio aestuarianus TaxID=28171 RepID=A0ABM9FNZ4_9VIBR|nr:hypothetical protein VAE122_2930017 [Vibrio aestuarianus]CAH8221707.1 hypothetical protein VAE063_920007 [Vibrio aestuarianus]
MDNLPMLHFVEYLSCYADSAALKPFPSNKDPAFPNQMNKIFFLSNFQSAYSPLLVAPRIVAL